MNRPGNVQKGRLVRGVERAVDGACVVEELTAVDGTDAIAKTGVNSVDPRVKMPEQTAGPPLLLVEAVPGKVGEAPLS